MEKMWKTKYSKNKLNVPWALDVKVVDVLCDCIVTIHGSKFFFEVWPQSLHEHKA